MFLLRPGSHHFVYGFCRFPHLMRTVCIFIRKVLYLFILNETTKRPGDRPTKRIEISCASRQPCEFVVFIIPKHEYMPVGGVAVRTASLIEKYQWCVCVVESAQLNPVISMHTTRQVVGNRKSGLSGRCEFIRKLSRSDTWMRIGSDSECFDLCRANDQRLLRHPNQRASTIHFKMSELNIYLSFRNRVRLLRLVAVWVMKTIRPVYRFVYIRWKKNEWRLWLKSMQCRDAPV